MVAGLTLGAAGEVEVGDAFYAGEVGLGYAPLPAALGPFVNLGGQDLGQEPEIGRLGPLGLLGQPGGVGAHHGEA